MSHPDLGKRPHAIAFLAIRIHRYSSSLTIRIDSVADNLRRERDPWLSVRKLADARRRGVCEVCRFDLHRTYGLHCEHRNGI